VGAEIDFRPVRTTDMKETVLDVAITANGQRTYVLLAEGKVSVQDARGLSLGTLQVGKGARAISTSPDGSLLYVADGQQLQTIAVELVQELDLAGSPFRGPEDAPVTIAVFNDFQ
jgi:DNA-binding beta-propeller fold protein YncE